MVALFVFPVLQNFSKLAWVLDLNVVYDSQNYFISYPWAADVTANLDFLLCFIGVQGYKNHLSNAYNLLITYCEHRKEQETQKRTRIKECFFAEYELLKKRIQNYVLELKVYAILLDFTLFFLNGNYWVTAWTTD